MTNMIQINFLTLFTVLSFIPNCSILIIRLNSEYFNLKIKAFDYEVEVLKVDREKYNCITFIKDVKVCADAENEIVEYYPDERFKVEAKLPLSRAKYLIGEDKDMNFIFQQYEVKGLKQIRFEVEAILVDIIDSVRLLETTSNCVGNEFDDEGVVDD